NRKASPSRFKSRPFRGTHTSERFPRYRRNGRLICFLDFAYCSPTELTVPEWMPRSLLLPAVRTFRSKPVGHFLRHLSACFCVSLQKFQTKFTARACLFSSPFKDFTR